jgi:hypothetical protein
MSAVPKQAPSPAWEAQFDIGSMSGTLAYAGSSWALTGTRADPNVIHVTAMLTRSGDTLRLVPWEGPPGFHDALASPDFEPMWTGTLRRGWTGVLANYSGWILEMTGVEEGGVVRLSGDVRRMGAT